MELSCALLGHAWAFLRASAPKVFISFQLRISRESCNRFFQLVQEVNAEINFIYNNENQNTTDSEEDERMLLKEILQHRLLEDISPSLSPSISVKPSSSQSPSSSPTLSRSPTVSQLPSSIPSSMPTIGGSDFVFVLLFVNGMCNGCPNDLFGSNQVVGRRNLHEKNSMQKTESPFRSLEDNASDDVLSNCFCPPNKVVVEGLLSSEDVVENLQQNLDKKNVSVVTNGVTEGTMCFCYCCKLEIFCV